MCCDTLYLDWLEDGIAALVFADARARSTNRHHNRRRLGQRLRCWKRTRFKKAAAAPQM
ncbi:hypothetical protein KCP73_11655 [Salmonella enterica subsp. enterica]|nr:hypothetical protein KCP73_11655 [Salmonella enterica subsp. enterica]